MVCFGQLALGPPGSGKSTYCEGLRQLCSALGRLCILINLDFANDNYAINDENVNQFRNPLSPPDVDVRELMTVERAMAEHGLGPNGGLVYCVDFLHTNIDWLRKQIRDKVEEIIDNYERDIKSGRVAPPKTKPTRDDVYLIIDTPGQVELYTHNSKMKDILKLLCDNSRAMRLCAVHLMDSTLCIEPHQYLSALLVALSAQVGTELPFLNILTKIDLLKDDQLDFRIEYYAEASELEYLVPYAHPSLVGKGKDEANPKEIAFAKFHQEIAQVVEEFNLVSMLPLDVQNKEHMLRVLKMADKANGYAFSVNDAMYAPQNKVRSVRDTLLHQSGGVAYTSDVWGDILENYNDP